MKKLIKIVAVLFAVVAVLFAGAAIFVKTLDADKYRPQLISLLNEKTGRTVKLNGPIAFSLGLGDVHVSVQDASIGNPDWASRPNMAGMGKFDLTVGLLPLLAHKLSISELSIENADILLETNAQGKYNWNFSPGDPSTTVAPTQAAPVKTTAASGESLSIDKLSIINSQLAMRSADGKISSYNVASLTIGKSSLGGAELKFKGDANGIPVTMDVATGIRDLLNPGAFDFNANIGYDQIDLTAKGKADMGEKKADISAYEIKAGKTSIKGNATVAWDGAKPLIRGTLNSDHIDAADFKTAEVSSGEAAAAPAEKKEAARSGKMFSDAPLPLDGLKAANAELDIAVGEFPLGHGALTGISAKLVLTNGNLSLAPLRATVGGQPVDMQVKLDASQDPARLTIGVIGNGIDLGDLQKLAGMTPFMTGKAGANIQLTAEGESTQAFASSLGGIIVITAEKGEILTGAAKDISSTLAALFNPTGGDAALNCLAARFNAKNGVLTDNGILIDSTPSTVSGRGTINLALDSVNLTLRANTKLINVGGLLPPLEISGSLEHPGYSVDAQGAVTNVVGNLLQGNLNIAGNNVPVIQTPPTGQNACIYTLDHPQAASSGSSILPSTVSGKASQQIQNLGNSLKGLFGK
jgi:uncharacterized protein involved in outer membrane biogenesis